MTGKNKNGVGYGQPPEHTKFKKGQSGNPKGRPIGSGNIKHLIYKLAEETIPKSMPDGRTELTYREAAARKFWQNVLNGDRKCLELYMQIEMHQLEKMTNQMEQDLRGRELGEIHAFLAFALHDGSPYLRRCLLELCERDEENGYVFDPLPDSSIFPKKKKEED